MKFTTNAMVIKFIFNEFQNVSHIYYYASSAESETKIQDILTINLHRANYIYKYTLT